jgi:MSHA pilin protein MshC
MSIRFSNRHGFTLIEIISVLTMISLLGAIVLSLNVADRTELSKEVDIVKTHLRYARYMALSNDVYLWGIQFSGNSYTFFKQLDGVMPPVITPAILPGESSDIRHLPPGITIAPVTIIFNKKGSATTSDPIQLSDGNGSVDITITQNTGFIK